jgi:hypothetical protein
MQHKNEKQTRVFVKFYSVCVYIKESQIGCDVVWFDPNEYLFITRKSFYVGRKASNTEHHPDIVGQINRKNMNVLYSYEH